MTTSLLSPPPLRQGRLVVYAAAAAQASGIILTFFGAIVFGLMLLILSINSILRGGNPLPPGTQKEIAGVFLFNSYLIVPGWFLTCAGFGLFPFRRR